MYRIIHLVLLGCICSVLVLGSFGCSTFDFSGLALKSKRNFAGITCFEYTGEKESEGFYCLYYIEPAEITIIKLEREIQESKYDTDAK